MPDILVVDDTPEILAANVSHLTEQGFAVTAAATGAEAIDRLREKQFDCIVLDILLPDMDGYAVCKAARELTHAPIIFLSCLDEVDDRIKGLSAGDDYMTKPYSLEELTARVHTRLRSGARRAPSRDAGLYIDYEAGIIQTCGKSVFLPQKVFELFLLLYENPRRVFSKEELLELIWRNNADMGTVAVHIMKLRRKIAFAEREIGHVETGYGEGYYWQPPESERGAV